MRFALINNEKVEAKRELKGQCPGCLQPVKAKCGEQRLHHWAHLPQNPCADKWSEPETQWHRDWKNHFPYQWQECRQQDQSTGEWHIADVCTDHGLVIEFQHSHLNPQERAARENFYKNMIWVVDGSRLKRDYPRFVKARAHFEQTTRQGFFSAHFPDECFPANWIESTVPVIFDFHGVFTNGVSDINEPLWCLLPGRAEKRILIAAIPQKQFVETVSSRSFLLPARELIEGFALNIRQNLQTEIQYSKMRHLRYQQLARRQRRRL